MGFPCGSDGKKSTCNAGDLGSILGLGRSLEEGMATHSRILAWRIPMDRGVWQATVHEVANSWTQLSDYAQHRKVINEHSYTRFLMQMKIDLYCNKMPPRLSQLEEKMPGFKASKDRLTLKS